MNESQKEKNPESDADYRKRLTKHLPLNCHAAIANASGAELDSIGASYHVPRG